MQFTVGEGKSLKYERSVYAAEQKIIGVDIDLDGFVAGLDMTLEGGVERGAEGGQ